MVEKQKTDEKVVPRDEQGRLVPGAILNPTGENGLRGQARWEKIVQYYRENWTVEELRAVATDPTRLAKMRLEYAEVIVHLAGTIAGKDRRLERESLYNRLWGTPVQTVISKNEAAILPEDIDKVTPERASRAYEQLVKE